MARNQLIPYRSDLKDKARKLRSESTHSEIRLWQGLKNKQILGYQFHRQVPLLDYIVDFYCHELKLAIEIDGDTHDREEAQVMDSLRQKRLEAYGVKVLRFTDNEVRKDVNVVLKEIQRCIEDWVDTPLNPPQGGM